LVCLLKNPINLNGGVCLAVGWVLDPLTGCACNLLRKSPSIIFKHKIKYSDESIKLIHYYLGAIRLAKTFLHLLHGKALT